MGKSTYLETVRALNSGYKESTSYGAGKRYSDSSKVTEFLPKDIGYSFKYEAVPFTEKDYTPDDLERLKKAVNKKFEDNGL